MVCPPAKSAGWDPFVVLIVLGFAFIPAYPVPYLLLPLFLPRYHPIAARALWGLFEHRLRIGQTIWCDNFPLPLGLRCAFIVVLVLHLPPLLPPPPRDSALYPLCLLLKSYYIAVWFQHLQTTHPTLAFALAWFSLTHFTHTLLYKTPTVPHTWALHATPHYLCRIGHPQRCTVQFHPAAIFSCQFSSCFFCTLLDCSCLYSCSGSVVCVVRIGSTATVCRFFVCFACSCMTHSYAVFPILANTPATTVPLPYILTSAPAGAPT